MRAAVGCTEIGKPIVHYCTLALRALSKRGGGEGPSSPPSLDACAARVYFSLTGLEATSPDYFVSLFFVRYNG